VVSCALIANQCHHIAPIDVSDAAEECAVTAVTVSIFLSDRGKRHAFTIHMKSGARWHLFEVDVRTAGQTGALILTDRAAYTSRNFK
jgi:hypothetical protein